MAQQFKAIPSSDSLIKKSLTNQYQTWTLINKTASHIRKAQEAMVKPVWGIMILKLKKCTVIIHNFN